MLDIRNHGGILGGNTKPKFLGYDYDVTFSGLIASFTNTIGEPVNHADIGNFIYIFGSAGLMCLTDTGTTLNYAFGKTYSDLTGVSTGTKELRFFEQDTQGFLMVLSNTYNNQIYVITGNHDGTNIVCTTKLNYQCHSVVKVDSNTLLMIVNSTSTYFEYYNLSTKIFSPDISFTGFSAGIFANNTSLIYGNTRYNFSTNVANNTVTLVSTVTLNNYNSAKTGIWTRQYPNKSKLSEDGKYLYLLSVSGQYFSSLNLDTNTYESFVSYSTSGTTSSTNTQYNPVSILVKNNKVYTSSQGNIAVHSLTSESTIWEYYYYQTLASYVSLFIPSSKDNTFYIVTNSGYYKIDVGVRKL